MRVKTGITVPSFAEHFLEDWKIANLNDIRRVLEEPQTKKTRKKQLPKRSKARYICAKLRKVKGKWTK